MHKLLLVSLVSLSFLLPYFSSAQEVQLLQDEVIIVKARVLEIVKEEDTAISGVSLTRRVQTVRSEIVEGQKSGEVVTFSNDYIILEKEEIFYLRITVAADNGRVTYTVQEPYRLDVIMWLTFAFVVSVVFIGGVQGIRGLASLVGSLVLIIYALLPGILAGYSPILVSVAVASLIIVVGSYVTHGFNKTTSSAVVGMIVTVIVTSILAFIAVTYGDLTGFSSDEAIYLNFDTRGSIDFVGLLMGGIMIGLLGVLYDVAIGQAISVEELHHIAPHVPRMTIYKRTIRMGREHIGALVNTLAIAYVGVSLPLLLLYMHSSSSPLSQVINSEVFATEIIRTMIGSIGLVLAVPITTLVSVFMLMKKPEGKISEEELKAEKEALLHADHAGHHHS